MKYIDPHIHCVSRTTDDYQYMARCGVVAVSEPAFWAGYDRSSAASFADYFRHLTGHRAAAGRAVRHRPLLLALHQRQGGRGRRAVARGHQADPAAARPPAGAGRRRDRAEQEHAERDHRLRGAGGPGRPPRSDDPDPHAAPGGQAQGDVDHHEHSEERQADQARARADRPLRRAHHPHGARERLLGRPDDLPRDQGDAAAGGRHPGDVRDEHDLREQRQRLGREQPQPT